MRRRFCWIGSMLVALVVETGCTADHAAMKGKVALDEHDLARAEAHYRRALGRDADHIGALTGLGWTYLLAGQHEAARGAFEQCLRVAATDPDCLRGRAGVATAVGNPALARQMINRALEADPMHAGAQSSLALLDLAAGQTDAAARRYEQLVDRHPNEPEYRLGLAEARIRQGRHEEAVEVIDKALVMKGVQVRNRAMLLQTQARALIGASAGRVDSERCAEAAVQVRAWVDAAQKAVDEAIATGVKLPDVYVVRRLVKRRRARLDELCAEEK